MPTPCINGVGNLGTSELLNYQVPKDDDHRNWPWNAQSAVQSDHCGFHHPDTAENNRKFSQKLWDTVTRHKDCKVDAVANSKKSEANVNMSKPVELPTWC